MIVNPYWNNVIFQKTIYLMVFGMQNQGITGSIPSLKYPQDRGFFSNHRIAWWDPFAISSVTTQGWNQFVINPQTHRILVWVYIYIYLQMADLLVLEQDTIHAFYRQVIRSTVINHKDCKHWLAFDKLDLILFWRSLTNWCSVTSLHKNQAIRDENHMWSHF